MLINASWLVKEGKARNKTFLLLIYDKNLDIDHRQWKYKLSQPI